MVGYKRKNKLYALDFTGTSLEGLEMTMAGLNVREFLDLSKLKDVAKATEDEQSQALVDLFTFVVGKVRSWNLVDDDGKAISPSVEEFMEWDLGDAFAAIEAWQNEVEGIPEKLGKASSSGSKWVGEPIPMDIPSPNLSN